MKSVNAFSTRYLLCFTLGLLVVSFLSCGGDDTDAAPQCGTPVWEVLAPDTGTSGEFSVDFTDERLNLSVERRFATLSQNWITGDFSARLTFADLELGDGGSFQFVINERYQDNNGSSTSLSGVALSAIIYASSSINQVMSSAGIPPDRNAEFGAFNSLNNDSGAIRITRRGNTLTVSTEIGFETIATSSEYQFTEGSTVGISIALGASTENGSASSVSLTGFTFEGNGAFSDDFTCNRLIE